MILLAVRWYLHYSLPRRDQKCSSPNAASKWTT